MAYRDAKVKVTKSTILIEIILGLLILGPQKLIAQAVYVTSGNGISALNLSQQSVVANIPTSATFLTMNQDGSRLYASAFNGLDVIDTSTNTILTTVPVGANPFESCLSPDGNKLYVAHFDSSSVFVIDTASNSIISTVSVPGNPIRIAISPDASRIYVSTRFNGIAVLNPATNSVVHQVSGMPSGATPLGISFLPDGSRAYIGEFGGPTFYVVDARTDTLIQTVTIPSTDGGISATASTPDGSRIYLTNIRTSPTQGLRAVFAVDSSTNAVIARITVGGATAQIAISSDGGRVLVGDGDIGNLDIIDVTSNSITASIHVSDLNLIAGVATKPPTLIRQGTFRPTRPMVVNRNAPTATLLNNGTVLVTGGTDGVNALSSAEIFDPLKLSFRLTKGSMSTPRYGNTATLLSDGRVLVEGGYDHIPTGNDPALGSAEIYDPVTDSFSIAGQMKTRHSLNRGKEVLLNNGQVLLAGGEANFTAGSCFGVLSTAQLYDPATNQFLFTIGSLTTSRQESDEVLLLDGRVLLSGGFDANCTILSSAELYDPSVQTFAPQGSLSTARLAQASVLLEDGRVLVTGGLNPGFVPQNSAEIYQSGVFTPSQGQMAHTRFAHTATLLDDGTVLIAGGTGDPSAPTSAEIYNPANDAFTPTAGSLLSAHSAHRAIKLSNGNVLLIGGGNPEIYVFSFAPAKTKSVWPMTGHDPQRTGLSPFIGPKNVVTGPSWTFTSGGPVIGDLVISAEGIIYFSSDKLYALNPDGTLYVPPVAVVPLTSPAIDDINGFIYVTARNPSDGYDLLQYSKQLQNSVVAAVELNCCSTGKIGSALVTKRSTESFLQDLTTPGIST